MSKKMIDADALDKLLTYISQEQASHSVGSYNEDIDDIFISFRKKINELATPAPEPQQSIFDALLWCRNMDLLKADGTHVLLFNQEEGVSVGWRTDAGIYGHSDLINLTEEYPKRERLDKIIQGCVIKWEAWKPFNYPTLPKEA